MSQSNAGRCVGDPTTVYRRLYVQPLVEMTRDVVTEHCDIPPTYEKYLTSSASSIATTTSTFVGGGGGGCVGERSSLDWWWWRRRRLPTAAVELVRTDAVAVVFVALFALSLVSLLSRAASFSPAAVVVVAATTALSDTTVQLLSPPSSPPLYHDRVVRKLQQHQR